MIEKFSSVYRCVLLKIIDDFGQRLMAGVDIRIRSFPFYQVERVVPGGNLVQVICFQKLFRSS